MNPNWVEWLGYLASITVLVSLLMASIVKLRWINLVGALLFSAYGVMIDSLPVALVNFCIALIDIYYLVQYYRTEEIFSFVEAESDSKLLKHFLDLNRSEIEKQAPIDTIRQSEKIFYLLRNNNIAGIIAGNRNGEVMEIVADYVTPPYQDFKIGEHYFKYHPEIFKERGINKLRASTNDEAHKKYLGKIGFHKVASSDINYEKVL